MCTVFFNVLGLLLLIIDVDVDGLFTIRGTRADGFNVVGFPLLLVIDDVEGLFAVGG